MKNRTNRLTQEQFEVGVHKNNPNLKITSEFKSLHSKISYKCMICGFEDIINDCNSLYRGHTGCGGCSGRKLYKGHNDFATKFPDLVKYFVNKEDAENNTYGSANIVKTICPTCGNIKNMKIVDIYSKGFSCPKCSDGFSKPERFMYNLLSQLNIDFETEVEFGWDKKRYRYDFVYKNIIIEMDGGFHKTDNHLSGQSKEQSKEIDKIKDNLAIKHGYKIIRIDCYLKDYSYIFDFIKDNIINSEIANLFDLSNIDWVKIDNNLEDTNIVKEVSKIWETHTMLNKDIAKKFHIGMSKLKRYLKMASNIGLIDYNEIDSRCGKYINPKLLETGRKKVICLNDNKVFESGIEADKYYGLSKDSVGSVCRGDKLSIHGLEFDFVDTTDEVQLRKQSMRNNKLKPSNTAKKCNV